MLIVLLGHVSNSGTHVVPGLDLHATAKAGVWLFFVLSAYLLTSKLIIDLGRSEIWPTLWRYAIRRVFRIIPTYFVFLLGLLLLSRMDGSTALMHATLLRGDNHLWTIPVEMKFYVLLPFLALGLVMVRSSYRLMLSAAMVGLSLVFYYAADPIEIANNTLSLANYLPFFATGILIAVTGSAGPGIIGWIGLAAIMVLTPRSLGALTGLPINQALSWSWLFAVAWGGIMYSAPDIFLRKCFTVRPLIFLGEISFSLYLVHYAVIDRLKASEGLGAFAGVVMIAVSVALAYAMYLFIETPSRNVGYRLTPTRQAILGRG